MPGYQLKPSNGRKLVNLSIKEHRGMVEKLNVTLKNVKEHDSTLFQSNGLALKQGEEFAHSFNVKQIECIEAKLAKATQDMEAIENKKRSYDSIFKGIHKQHINKRRRKKENRRKSNEGKRKRTETNIQRVYGICVGTSLGNDLAQCLVYPPILAVPEEFIKVEDVATSLFRRGGPYIAQLLEGNYFSNGARSRITTNLQQKVRDYVYTFMYPEEYTTESISKTDSHSSTSGEEELDDSEDEDECQWKLYWTTTKPKKRVFYNSLKFLSVAPKRRENCHQPRLWALETIFIGAESLLNSRPFNSCEWRP